MPASRACMHEGVVCSGNSERIPNHEISRGLTKSRSFANMYMYISRGFTKHPVVSTNTCILVGFGRATHPCAAQIRLSRLINMQNGALRGSHPPTHNSFADSLSSLKKGEKKYFMSEIRTRATRVMGSPGKYVTPKNRTHTPVSRACILPLDHRCRKLNFSQSCIWWKKPGWRKNPKKIVMQQNTKYDTTTDRAP